MGQGDPYLVSHLALKISVAKFYDERFLLWRERHIMHKLGVARMLERCPAGTPNADASALTQGSAAHCALVQNLQLNTSVHVVLNRARTEPSSSNTLSMEATLSGSNKALELSQQKSHTYGFLMCTKKWTSPKLYYNLLSAKGTDPQRAEIMRGMQEWSDKNVIAINHGIFLHKVVLNAIETVQPNPGLGITVFFTAEMGFSIIAFKTHNPEYTEGL